MRGLLTALGFLTRLPMPASAFGDPRTQAASLPWYPAVGLVLGVLLGMLAWLLHTQSPPLAAGIVLVAWVVLTGALHLDGLADSADAWIGGMGDRERTLAIMKDPRCGPAGVLALVLCLLLKFAALSSMAGAWWPALLLAPVLARVGLVGLFLTTDYVRGNGLGSPLTDAPRGLCLAAIAIALGACLLAGWRGVLGIAAAGLVFFLWRRAAVRRLGGFSGDVAGALTELIEVVVLLALAIR